MLHRSCDRANVRENYAYDNAEAGIALFETSDCKVYKNTLENNRCKCSYAYVYRVCTVFGAMPTVKVSHAFCPLEYDARGYLGEFS